MELRQLDARSESSNICDGLLKLDMGSGSLTFGFTPVLTCPRQPIGATNFPCSLAKDINSVAVIASVFCWRPPLLSDSAKFYAIHTLQTACADQCDEHPGSGVGT